MAWGSPDLMASRRLCRSPLQLAGILPDLAVVLPDLASVLPDVARVATNVLAVAANVAEIVADLLGACQRCPQRDAREDAGHHRHARRPA